jgi:hypothetical protein
VFEVQTPYNVMYLPTKLSSYGTPDHLLDLDIVLIKHILVHLLRPFLLNYRTEL